MNRKMQDAQYRVGGYAYRADIMRGLENVPFRRVRQSGTTTALSLRTISIALQHPNTKVVIIDHHGTRGADRFMADQTRRLIDLMKLKFITVLVRGPSSPCVVHHPGRENYNG